MTVRAQAEALARCATETQDDLSPLLAALHAAIAGTPAGELDDAAARLDEAARRPCAIEREVSLYLASGALIEGGADPAAGWPQLQARLAHGLTVLAAALDRLVAEEVVLDAGETDAKLDAELLGWVRHFRLFVVAAMARLARSPALRKRARSMRAFVEGVETVQHVLPSQHGAYLSEILGVLDGPLLVVDLIA